MTATISTLAELLDSAGTTWRVFDLGRRVQKIDKALFLQIEQTLQPYPYPQAQHALLAIQFWDKQRAASPYVWFLKLPLDEQSKLIAASRDHFANMVLEALGTELTGDDKNQAKLDNNPYVFTPNANKRAAFNALVKVELKQPASKYYEQTQLYFSGKLGFDDWQALALQGIADFAARLDHDNNQANLLAAWQHLPAPVRQPLCAMLENITINTPVAETLQQSALTAIEQNDKALLIDCLRAISHTPATGLVSQLLEQVMQSPFAHDSDICQVIAGRCWQQLNQPERLKTFMENCAANTEEPALFSSIFADLVAIALLRPHLLALLRDQNRSPQLTSAIGKLFT